MSWCILGCAESHCCLWASTRWGEQELLSSCGARASHCSCFSCWGAQALESVGSGLVVHELSCSSACGVFSGQGAISKKGNAKECSNYRTIALILHASKVMLKILQARLQQYMNWQRNQRSNCQHLLDNSKSKRVPEKHLFLLYWLCQSPWLCGSQ